MSWDAIARRFRAVGVPIRPVERRWFSIDVSRDRAREAILLGQADASIQVIDDCPEQEQLLLLVKDTDGWNKPTTRKILCGRDEQSLFVVTVPGWGRTVNSVAAAHEALKPREVVEEERDGGGYGSRRKTCRRGRSQRGGILRQGEWFFLPRPWIRDELYGVRKRARLGWGNPHVVDELVGNPNKLSTGFGWSSSLGTGAVLARGFVRHREHRPLNLRCWHRVIPNTAIRAPGNFAD